MLKFYTTNYFGYGKIVKKYSSDLGSLQNECKIRDFWGEYPLYFVREYDRYGELVSTYEFFTGIELKYGGLRIYPDCMAKEHSAVAFETMVNDLSESKKRKIAAQVKEMNERAIEFYRLIKLQAERQNKANNDAAERLRSTKKY